LDQFSQTVTWREVSGVAIAEIDNPPVNALSASVRAGLTAALARAAKRDDIAGLVICCAGKSFISGADITEFSGEEAEPTSQAVMDALDAMAKPVAAAMHVRALGGGLEVALACHRRVARPDTVFGFPEVKLGIMPGLGGTQRSPRLVGYGAALDLIVSGDPIDAGSALKMGLIDAVDDDPVAAAVRMVREDAANGRLVKARELEDHRIAARQAADLFDAARKTAGRRWPKHDAPLRAIEAVEFGLSAGFDEAIDNETRLCAECLDSEESKALISLFFAERQTRFAPGLPKDTGVQTVSRVGVLGAGAMGRGIATAALDADLQVRLVDAKPAATEQAAGSIARSYTRSVERGRVDEATAAKRQSNLLVSNEIADLSNCDLVIEAVFEDMAIKQSVFATLDKVCRGDALLASNTSGLDLDQIARATSRPGDVIGLHFFNPANIMKLLEVVRGAASTDIAVATGVDFARRLGKLPIVSRVGPNFIANRVFDYYFRQAEFLVEEGADPEAVDEALEDWGMAMGPFAVVDLSGLDVSHAIRQEYPTGHPEGTVFPAAEDELFAAGRLGQKSGAGWYRYQPGSVKRERDPEIAEMMHAYRLRRGFTPRSIGREEIVQRCLLALINEAANVLMEGIAGRASDIDIASVYGYGFPRRRGGPIFQADMRGTAAVLAEIEKLHEAHGYWWRPSPLLLQLGADNTPFSQFKPNLPKTGAQT
jgi:3-hydroxyacyl-CoA dehydrogenase